MLHVYSFCEVTHRVWQAVWGESGTGTFRQCGAIRRRVGTAHGSVAPLHRWILQWLVYNVLLRSFDSPLHQLRYMCRTLRIFIRCSIHVTDVD
ncbi:hypothetical protein D2E46_24370 [Mycobacteroides abscessus]|nr:hypothetical protein D2E46_24370 [Mycobacteroides abscessus]